MRRLRNISQCVFLSLAALSFFQANADGLPCKDFANQIWEISTRHYLFNLPSTHERLSTPQTNWVKNKDIAGFTKAFISHFVDRAAEKWIQDQNNNLVSHITLAEEEKIKADFQKLKKIALRQSTDCSPLIEIQEIRVMALLRFKKLFESQFPEMKSKATDPALPYYFADLKTRASMADESAAANDMHLFLNSLLSEGGGTAKNQSLSTEKKLENIAKTIREFKHQMDITNQDVLLSELAEIYALSLDPHSEYFTPVQSRDFGIEMEQEETGFLGFSVSLSDNFYLKVEKITPNGAAAKSIDETKEANKKSGEATPYLQVNDEIVAIAQGHAEEGDDFAEDLNFIDTSKISIEDASDALRGNLNSYVTFQVHRAGRKDNFNIALKRQKVEENEINPFSSKIIEQKDSKGVVRKIGVIAFKIFHSHIAAQVKEATLDLQKKGAEAIVIDLRSNGGGDLGQVGKMVDSYIAKGVAVNMYGTHGSRSVPNAKEQDPGIDYSGPLVIAINNYSASASEIFAGALQDYRRALIVGSERSYGKGTVQTLIDHSDGSAEDGFKYKNSIVGAIKFTVAGFYLPSGRSTQFYAVRSNVVLPSERVDLYSKYLALGEAYNSNSLKLKPAQSVLDEYAAQGKGDKAWTPINTVMISKLNTSLRLRLKNDKEAQAIAEYNKRVASFVNKGSFSVADHLALLQWKNANLPDSKTDESDRERLELKPEKFLSDREILSVSADLVSLMPTKKTAVIKRIN